MAKQLNVNLSFAADTSQAAAQVRNLQQSLTQLVNQPVGIGQRLSEDILKATHAAAELKMHLQSATNVNTGTLDFGRLNQSLKASGVSLQQYAIKLQSLGPQGQQAFMQLARSVANAEVPLRRSNALLTQFSTTLANTARWQLSSAMLHGFISAVSSAWNYSKDLNESLNNIRIVTGYNIDQMSRFADQANRAAKALSTTTTEYTNASLIYYQQGLSDAEVLGRTETTIKMANASRQSAEIVSDQMTAIWNNFYDGSKSLEYYADVVTALGAATASSSEEIAQGLEKFAAVADTVGLSYEYATAALATVTATTRQSADVVGTAFKTLFARLSDLKLGETLEDGTTLGQYSENLAKVGVNIKDASGQLKDMDTILNETAAKWENLDKAQQVALAKGVAGIRQYTQFIALMDNWDFMEENLGTVAGSGGTLERQAKTYEQSWEAASKRVKASLETIYASIMDDEFFIDLTDGFADLISHVGGFIKSIGGLQGVLSGLGWILTKVFAEQMTQGFQNLYYNIQMSSQAGREAMQNFKVQQMKAFADSMVSPEGGNQVDLTRQQVYKDELLMQQQLMEKADQLTAAEQNKYKVLIEQHRVMGEQSIELAKQLELTKEKVANSSTELLGTGLNNGLGMKDAMGAIGYARESAQSMASVEQVLQKINSTSKVTTAQIDQLQQEFYSLGASDDVVMEISHALWNASGNADQMEEACIGVKARLSQLTGDIPKIVAELLGIKPGAEGFAELSQKVAQYMGHAKQAKIETDNLKVSTDNGSASVNRFGESLAQAGQKAQSASQLLSTTISGLMSMGMLISSISGLIDTIKDPDASGWEKFGRILTSVSMIGMSVMGTFTGLKAAYELLSSGIIKNTLITSANSIANSINEKQQKKNNVTKGAGVAVGKKANAITRQGTTETYRGTIALRKENAEKRKSIALDKMRGKTIKKPTVDKTPKLEKGTLKTLGKAAGRWGAAAAAVAIVATTITLATESYNKHNKAAKEAAQQAKEAADAFGQVSQAYSDFTSKVDTYENAVKGLEELTKGTDEYREAIIKANDATIELLSQYEDLQYSINEEGLIVLDETTLREVQKREAQRVKDAQMANLSAQQNASNKQIEADSINFQRDKLKSDNASDVGEIFGNGAIAGVAGAGAAALATFALINAWNPAGWAALIVGGIAAIVGGVVTASVGQANEEESQALELLSKEYEKNGNARFADVESFKSLLSDLNITDKKLIDSLVENRAATLSLVKEMALNNSRRDSAAASQIYDQYGSIIQAYGLNDNQTKDVSAMIGASMDDRVNALYEKTYKDKGTLGGGMTDAEVQKAYAKAMGWAIDTIENQNGNKAKYYKKDGTEVGVISDEVARRYLAEKAAYQDLEQAVRNATKQFVKLVNSTLAYEQAMADFLTSGDFSTMSKVKFDALQAKVGGKDGIVDEAEAKSYIDSTFARGEELTDEEAMGYGFNSAQMFYDTFFAGFNGYLEDRDIITSKISDTAKLLMDNSGFNIDDLSSVQLKKISSVIDHVIAIAGDDAGAFMSDLIAAAGDQAELFAETLNTIDWSSATPDSLSEKLRSVGISAHYSESVLNDLISVMRAGFIPTIDEINNKIAVLEKVSKLKQGDTIDEDQYLKLSASAQSYFQVMADGTYKLVQDAQEFYTLVNNELKQQRVDGIKADIEKSLQIKNSIQYTKDTLTQGTKNNYGYDTYEEYIKKSFGSASLMISASTKPGMGNNGQMAKSVKVEDGQLVMPHMWGFNDNGNLELGGVAATQAIVNGRPVFAGGSIQNEDGTTTYAWQEVKEVDTGPTKDTSIVKKSNLYTPVTVYTNETDYQASVMKTSVDKASRDQASRQVDFLKSTSFGQDEANAATIKAWEDAIKAGTLTGEAAAAIAEATTDHLHEYEGLVAQDMEVLDHIEALTFQHLSAAESAVERETEYQSLLGMAQNEQQIQSIDQAYLNSVTAAIAEEKNEGLDPEEVDNYAEHLMEVAEASELLSDDLKDNEKAAKDVATYTIKMNKGIDKLADGFEDWSSILKKSDKASEEYSKAMTDMKDAMSDVLGVEEEFLTDDFILKNLEDIEKAATGDAEAIDRLAIAAGREILIDFSMKDKGLEKKLLDMQDTLLNKIPKDIEVGATLNADDFGTAAQDLIDTACMSVEEAQAYFNSLGYEPVFETETKEVTEEVPQHATDTQTYIVGETDVKEYAGMEGEGENATPKYVTVKKPIMRTLTTTTQTGTAPMTTTKEVPILYSDGKGGKKPKIKELRKKSSGSMNNYSGSNSGGKKPGSGGGGGGGSKPKKADTVKKTDVVDRYKEIDDKLGRTRSLLEKNSTLADGLWGKARLQNMQSAINLMEKENQQLEERAELTKQYLAEDKQALVEAATTAGVSFEFDDETGFITNYTEQMTALWTKREALLDSFGKTISNKEQKKLDAMDEKIEALAEAYETYEASLDEQQEAEENHLSQLLKIQQAYYDLLTEELNIELEINKGDLAIIEYYISKMANDFYSMAEAAAQIWNSEGKPNQAAIYADELGAYSDYKDKLISQYTTINPQTGESYINQENYIQGLQASRDGIIENLNNLLSLDETMQSYYGDTLAAAQEELGKYTALMDHHNSVLDHYRNLMELTGKSIDYKKIGTILEAQAKTAENSYKVSEANYKMLAQQAKQAKENYEAALIAKKDQSELDMLEQMWIDAQTTANDAQEEMLSDLETWVESFNAILENNLADANQIFENALTGDFGSFNQLITSMEHAKSLQEEYLTDTNKIYETNKLMRQAQKEIDKTTNSVAKQKLKQFITETSALQEQGKLSQFELEIQQAKYDLLLAEIALKEAQNAKSTVRLQRDSEGNFGYVYTADESAIEDAQQKVDDAQNALYNKGLEGANDYAEKWLSIYQEMFDKLAEIDQAYKNGEYESEEEYQKARNEAIKYYSEQLRSYADLYNIALGVDPTIAVEAWGATYTDLINDSSRWQQAVTDHSGNVSSAFKTYADNIKNSGVKDALEDIETATTDIVTANEALTKSITEENGLISKLEEEITAVGNLTTAYAAHRLEIQETIKEYENLLTAINKLISNEVEVPEVPEVITPAETPEVETPEVEEPTVKDPSELKKGDQVQVKDTARKWNSGTKMASWVPGNNFTAGKVDLKNGTVQLFNPSGPNHKAKGYTGKIKITDLVGFDTGGYTGAWGSYGKLAMLHEKEMVLNKQDTENFLASMDLLNHILEIIDLQSASRQIGGILSSPFFASHNNNRLEQSVHIEANFPSVTDRNEIEEAFNNLINTASQYANRK